MAEIAIPLIALGSMYVISNQDKEKKREGYTNPGRNPNELPGVVPPPPPVNYPIDTPVTNANVQKYASANQATDKYFGNGVYEKTAYKNPGNRLGGVQQTYSLTGKAIDKSDFKHNNMVPFFGAKIKGATVSADIAETVLDNMQGAGSQIIRKTEQAPLFKPQQNLQFASGAPNASDFLQSRVNPSMRMANVKPWEEERVGPGLGKGFTTAGSGGFNSGMEDRNAWLPKTVNELRVDTNPKMTFGMAGHEGPANAYIKRSANIKTQGKVEKYQPDTYFASGPDRWFTTTGLEKAQTARGIEVLQNQNRTTTSCQYFGDGQGGEATYTKGNYQPGRRPELDPHDVTNAHAPGTGTVGAGDYGVKGHVSLPTNRSTTRYAPELGAVHGMMRAMVAPLFDALRPSRKENVVGNIRPNGNAGTVVSNLPVYNPADRTRTTIRQMTEGELDCNHLNVENQAGSAYLVSKQRPVDVQRDTTSCPYSGSAGPSTLRANPSRAAALKQHNNVNKGYVNRPNQGGTQIFNQNDNVSVHRKEVERVNNRPFMPGPGGGCIGPCLATGAIPSVETYGKINTPQYYNECMTCERINPDILTAFKQNPYTQSLSSWAAP